VLQKQPLTGKKKCRHTADMEPKQTLTGIIRSRMTEYEARRLAGVTQKTFAEELTAEGHPISYADFRTLYARARKQLRDGKFGVAPGTARKEQQGQQKQASQENPLTKKVGFEHKHRDDSELI
jgi:hypothetical protein